MRFDGYPESPALAAATRAQRDDQIAALLEEQHPHAVPGSPRLEPEPAPEPVQQAAPDERVVLVCGAASWATSIAGPIPERLVKLPLETTVLVTGDVESRSKKGLPTGVAVIAAVIAWAAGLALGLQVESAQDVEAALARSTRIAAFHLAIDRSRATAAVVEQARALGRTVEVITGRPTVPTRGGLLRAQHQEAAQ